jgi:hypothetical protein
MAYYDDILASNPLIYLDFYQGGASNNGSLTCSPSTGPDAVLNTSGGVALGDGGYLGNTNKLYGGIELEVDPINTQILTNKQIATISGWFKLNSTTTNAFGVNNNNTDNSYGNTIFFSKTNTSGSQTGAGNRIYIDPYNGQFLCVTSTTGGSETAYLSSGGSGNGWNTYDFRDNKWHHFAVVYNGTGTSNSTTLYIDGDFVVGSINNPIVIQNNTSTADYGVVSFGRGHDYGPTNVFKAGFLGDLDELCVFDSALSEATIQSHYYKTKTILSNTIASYAPEQYLAFNHPYRVGPTNFGTGGSSTFTLTNEAPTFMPNSGPLYAGAWRFGITSGGTDATPTRFRVASSSTSAVLSPELNDGNFTSGFWFKTNFTLSNALEHMSGYTLHELSVNSKTLNLSLAGGSANSANKGKLRWINPQTSAFTYSANRIDDQQWHYIAVRHVSTGTGTWEATLFIDGTLSDTANFSATASAVATYGFGTATATIAGLSGASDLTTWEFSDAHIAPYTTIDTVALTDIYNAGLGAAIDNINYPAEAFVVTLAEAVMPTFSTENVIDITLNADPKTASAEMVHPTHTHDANADAFGFDAASAEFVMPTIAATSNVSYAADPQTASADIVHPTVAAEIYVDYAASPMTASALLSSNLFFGETVQDTAYNLIIREINNTTNVDGNNGFNVGTYWASNAVTEKQTVAIKPNSGFPINTELVKVKINPAAVTISSTNDASPLNTFDVYVFTANPGTTFNTMTYGNLPTKQFIGTTRLVDDGSSTQFYLDLTAAFANPNAHSYGVLIEANTNVIVSGTTFDRTAFTGSNLQNQLFYVLTTDYVNKNINADIMTASAVDVMPTVYVERFINFHANVATSSGDFIDPDLSTSTGVILSQAPLTASALAVQPAFQGDALPVSGHLEAFATSPNATVAGQKTVNYSATVTTASALFSDPQFNIGEVNSADHMNASALFVNPLVVINRTVLENPAIATASFPNATVTTQLLGTIYATPMTASALSVLPSNFIQLTDDPWYVRLYAQHSQQKTETGSTGLPGISKTFFKFFAQQSAEITLSSNTSLSNQMPRKAFGPPNDTDATTYSANPFAPYGALTPTPKLETGYLDIWNRTAVKLQNISFDLRDTVNNPDTGTTSDRGYSLEFTIKTNKQNQILASGNYTLPNVFTQRGSAIGINDGKLYGMALPQPKFGSALPLHPKNLPALAQAGLTNSVNLDDAIITSNRTIADGQWHHVVIQYGWTDGRIQIWIDGNLDIQRSPAGVGGTIGPSIRPHILGFNNTDTRFASDFETSGWSYAPNSFLLERDLDLNYIAATKSKAYEAEAMTANASITDGSKGKGNRGRMLMLYWWPQYQYNPASDPDYIDNTPESFDNIDTIDYNEVAPEPYYGWDVYPIDVTGRFLSDMTRPEAVGGEQNIKTVTNFIPGVPGTTPLTYKVNRRGYFRDTITDMPRYINLQTDIDLADFDIITFRNFPEDSSEIDAYTRNEFVDSYFGITESKIYEDFLKSIRDAVDAGIGLYITNRKLAVDLGIVDRVEEIPALRETELDEYANTIAPSSRSNFPATESGWIDNHFNSRHRVVNTVEDFTDTPIYTWTDALYYYLSDVQEFGGIDRDYKRVEYRPNGLQIGDTFLMSNHAMLYLNDTSFPTYGFGTSNSYPVFATPIANVKAGKVVTAFANTYRRGTTEVENPYRNYATSIAVQPGDILNGKPVGGKIFVNFTEYVIATNDVTLVDLVQDEFINKAYDEGKISLTKRNELLAAPQNLDRKMEAAILANNANQIALITKQKYWSLNGDYIVRSAGVQYSFEGEKQGGISNDRRSEVLTKFNPKSGRITNSPVYSDQQWFTFEYGRAYETLPLNTPSLHTLGFWWLSDKTAVSGLVLRTEAVTASATMVQPVVVADSDKTVYSAPMVASTTIVNPPAYTQGTVNIVSLPMNAIATFGQFVRRITAEPMTATALLRTNILTTAAEVDQVVVYIEHVDPIVYLREEVIK